MATITVSEVKGILTRLNKQQSVKGKIKVFTADALKICFTEKLGLFIEIFFRRSNFYFYDNETEQHTFNTQT